MLGQAFQLLRLRFQLGGTLGHAVLEVFIGRMQAVVDLADDAVAAPQPDAGPGQQHQQERRIGEQIAPIALAHRQRGVERAGELASQAVEGRAGGGGGDLRFQAVFQRALFQDHAAGLDDGVHLLDHGRREGDFLGRDVAQDLVDTRGQRRRGNHVVAQDLGEQGIERGVQAHHQPGRRQRAFDAAEFRLEVGHRGRQIGQRLAQWRIVARELDRDQFLALHGVAQLGIGAAQCGVAIVGHGLAQAHEQGAHARQLGGQLRGRGRAADVGAQDVGIPFGVELFQLAQAEHDVVADFGIGRFRTDEQEGEQQGQHHDRRACKLQAATRCPACYPLRQHGNHLLLRYTN